MNRKIFLTCLLLLLPLCVLAENHLVTDTNLSAYKELTQARTEALKESLQKDIQAQAARIEAEGKRIDRQDKLLDSFSTRISDLSFFLTVAGFVAALMGYFTVSSRAKNEARIAAAEWIEKEGQKAIATKLKELDSHIAVQAATAKLDQLYADAAVPLAELQKQMTASQKTMDGSVQNQSSLTDMDAISKLVEELKLKPEAEYGFDDWNLRAFDAQTKGNLALAAEYWLQAAQGGNARGLQVVQSLFNAAFALGQLNRNKEAMDIYDDIVTRYGNAPETELRMHVAFALINKGVILSQLKRDDEAVSTYDKVITFCGSAPEAKMQEILLNALVNRGLSLGNLQRLDEAETVFDNVLSRFGSTTEVALRAHVANALNGKGFTLLCRAKEKWGDEQARLSKLQAAKSLFDQSEKEVINKPYVWGNQAYAAFLLGDVEAAILPLTQALKQGGENIYNATLGDLNFHPAPPDVEFRNLLEKTWAEVKPKA
jgi:tetratricopeptide (TPR) repeat protein